MKTMLSATAISTARAGSSMNPWSISPNVSECARVKAVTCQSSAVTFRERKNNPSTKADVIESVWNDMLETEPGVAQQRGPRRGRSQSARRLRRDQQKHEALGEHSGFHGQAPVRRTTSYFFPCTSLL